MAASDRRKYELALVVGIVAIVAAFLFPALERTRAELEESALQAEITAIRVELLERIAHRELAGGALPQSANPLQWIARVPRDYLGEFTDAATLPAKSGVWYFDRAAGELVYRYRRGGEARFRLVRDGAGAEAKLAGVGLVRVESAK